MVILTMKPQDLKENKQKKNIWLTKNVLVLGIVSFFSDISGEMMTPVLPLFIAALGGTSLIIGLIGGLGDAVASIVKVFSGYLADRTGRRKQIITLGYGIPFFAKLSIGLSNTWEQLLVLKPVERLGKGIRDAPRDSLVADSTELIARGKAFGFHRMMDTAGAILGSVIALFLTFSLYDVLYVTSEIDILRLILIISAFFSLLAVFPIILLTEPTTQDQIKLSRNLSLKQSLKDLPKDYYKFLIVSILFGLANFTILLFIYYARTAISTFIGFSTPLDQIGFTIGIFIWFNIIYTILSIPFGSWSDKYGRKMVFSIGLLLFILTCMIFLLTTNFFFLIAAFGLYGAFNAATDGIQKAFTVDLIPSNLKATGLGLLQTLTGIAGIFGGIIAGFLYELNYIFMFLYGAGMASIALILLIAFNIPSKVK